jgi:hypothetical protein
MIFHEDWGQTFVALMELGSHIDPSLRFGISEKNLISQALAH